MANERLYRENVLFALAEPEAFADRNEPTVDELNNATLVYNVTCALWEDETEFTLGDPDTDDGLTFCSKAGISTPTFDNPTVVFSALRDADRTATGVFNGTFERLAFPDREYVAILRVGKDSDVAFAAGDIIKMAAVATDYPVDTLSNGENARITQNFLNRGWVNWNYTVEA
jgi:hypothetical protein